MQTSVTPTPAPTLPASLRTFLYLTAAINGAAILVVEILGAKMLAPYVGTSHFVWTAQISVTLLSLATGYYVGGRMVDRAQDLGRLYQAMLWAAAYLALTISVTERVSYWCMDFGAQLGGLDASIKIGSILASGFLFFVPLTLLAMTGPFLIRILTSTLSGVGGQAGRLSAISTLGSVLGAALIGYVLIPHLPNSRTMFFTAGGLALLSLVYFFFFGQRRSAVAKPILLAVASVGLGLYGVKTDFRTDYGRGVEIFRSNSNYGMLQVIQLKNSAELFYVNDYLTQNIYHTNTQQSGAMFTYMLHALARGYSPKLESALCIGMGVGIVPSQLAREGVKVEVVEINEGVVPIAEKFFDLKPDQLTLHIGDGRHFLNRTTNRYDAVILDAFLGDSSPSHLMTREAFASMRHVLNPGGCIVLNCFGYFDRGRDYFVGSLEKTLQSVFKTVKIHDSGRGNVFMAASDLPEMTLVPPTSYDYIHSDLVSEVQRTLVNVVATDPQRGRILTDDYNPVDYYDAVNRETFRRNMAKSMDPDRKSRL
ncbi:MAG: fused MFS/spermidine synthase [Verrucomicrobiales bacterium]|nr:fused MFS/spermidine synthase [Verrucomicrobiales bacterium]